MVDEKDEFIKAVTCKKDQRLVLGHVKDDVKCISCKVNAKNGSEFSSCMVTISPMNRRKKKKTNVHKEIALFDKMCNICSKFKWTNCAIPSSAILLELFEKYEIKGELKDGFLLTFVDGEKFAFWHCWVETKHGRYDVSTRVARMIDDEVDKLYGRSKQSLSEIVPNDYIRIDICTKEGRNIDKENLLLLEKYRDNPKQFFTTPFGDAQVWINTVTCREIIMKAI